MKRLLILIILLFCAEASFSQYNWARVRRINTDTIQPYKTGDTTDLLGNFRINGSRLGAVDTVTMLYTRYKADSTFIQHADTSTIIYSRHKTDSLDDPRETYLFMEDFDGFNTKVTPYYSGSSSNPSASTLYTNRPGIVRAATDSREGYYTSWYAPNASSLSLNLTGIYPVIPNLTFSSAIIASAASDGRYLVGLNVPNLLRTGIYYRGEGSGCRSFAIACTTSNGSTNLTSAALFTVDHLGRAITGTNIPAGTYVKSILSTSSITMSAAATGSGAITGTFAALGKWCLVLDASPTANIVFNTGIALTETWVDLEFRTNATADSISSYIGHALVATYPFSGTYRYTGTLNYFVGVVHCYNTGASPIFVDYLYCKFPIAR